MHKIYILLLSIVFFISAHAQPLVFQNSKAFSSKNGELFLQRFVREPHPFGSQANQKLAQDIRDSLAQFGLKLSLQEFQSPAPDIVAIKKRQKTIKTLTGHNIVASIPGPRQCAVILGGHYDTKFLDGQNFIGANDGGSSTALLVELARVAKQTNFEKNSLGACSLYFVLFDGEESLLPEWDDGKKLLNIQDNLYGSSAFVKMNLKQKNKKTTIEGKEISLVFILDMIGHKEQNLFITQGSNSTFADEFISTCKNTVISKAAIYIEDDQVPFIKYQVPILHIIDWTNLSEWHTVNDNLRIISYTDIAQLGENILDFLQKK